MNSPIRRLTLALLIGFCLLLANVVYIQAVAADRYRSDHRNARVQLARSERERGVMVDRSGAVLVSSEGQASTFLRTYPFGDLLGHPIGFSSLLFGDRGLEAAYATDLRSKQDLTISNVIAGILGNDLRPANLRLTIDVALQQVAAEALGDQVGAVVAIEPSTGAILAYVSTPGFDPALLIGGEAGPAGDTLDADPAEPLRDRVVNQLYAPGSIFKIVTTAAALESGEITVESTFSNPTALALPGSESTISNADGHTCGSGAEVSLARGFVLSCNTTFAQIAMTLGAGALEAQAEAFGFGSEIPFVFPVAESMFSPVDLADDLPALAQTSIGQRDVRVTPLHMALMVAGIANRGDLMSPYLVSEIIDGDGQIVTTTQPAPWRKASSESTALAITQLMVDAVNSGTGAGARIDGVQVAGKTGTAENPDQAPHAWFVGFAPADQPTIAIAVVVEFGGLAGDEASGGQTAAPIAQKTMERWLKP
ncbi:MAG: penicillin-binding transpeptidase domain-containing protein [Acidimicrobiia bacterium]|nr:penicillin-binding transpeptidase domain-containing protein [Acidimicrobiia bacterium]MDH5503181.1 penicillin-binding transpeptidase domain-containing protein [Acidimicrobiia bacterium]